MQLFLLPHVVAGPAIIGFGLFLATILLTGSTVSGTISRLDEKPGSESGTDYILHYDYNVSGQQFHASSSTTKGTYQHLKPGDPVTLKVLPQCPGLAPQVMDGNSHASIVGFTLGFGVLWSLLMFLPGYDIFIGPHKRTKVMTNGKVLTGRITEKVISGEDNDRFSLRFQYEPTPGQLQTTQREVTREQFTQAQTGERVSVLYDASCPAESLIYRYSDYELTSLL